MPEQQAQNRGVVSAAPPLVASGINLVGQSAAQLDDHVRQRLGPKARLHAKPVSVKAAIAATDSGGATESSSPRTVYRATVIFRQFGFTVDWQPVQGPSDDEARRIVAEYLLSSNMRRTDVPASGGASFSPGTAKLFEELKYFTVGLGRDVRFRLAVVSAVDSTRYRCVAMVRDQWSMHAKQFEPLLSAEASTAWDAFCSAARAAHEIYRVQAEASPQALEDVRELRVFLKQRKKSVFERVEKDPQDSPRGPTYTGTLTVVDEYSNSYTMTAKGQKTSYAAYRSCALQVYKYELNEPCPTFLQRVVWQLEGMCHHTSNALLSDAAFSESVSIGDSCSSAMTDECKRCDNDELHYEEQFGDDGTIVGTLSHGASVLGSEEGKGRYRVELLTYKTALQKLIEFHPDVASLFYFTNPEELDHEHLFLTASTTVEALHGVRVTPYSVLGNCCALHFGGFYTVKYSIVQEDADSQQAAASNARANSQPQSFKLAQQRQQHVAEVSVYDGVRTPMRVLGTATAHAKGQAWKDACIAILREDFPEVFEQVRSRGEFTDDNGLAATAKLRSLPRDKRIAHFSSLSYLLKAFGLEERGWVETVIDADMTPDGQWVGVVRAKTSSTGSWATVAHTEPVQLKSVAKRLVVIVAAKQYFPVEYATYSKLDNRGDATLEEAAVTSRYAAGKPLIQQLLQVLERGAPHLEPVTVDVEADANSCTSTGTPSFTVTVISKCHLPQQSELAVVKGTSDTGVFTAIRQAIRNAMEKKCPPTVAEAKVLLREHSLSIPPNMLLVKDLCMHLFNSCFGKDSIEFEEELRNDRWWCVTAVIPSLKRLPVSRGYALSKKEASRLALISATRSNFHRLLEHFAKHSIELQGLADEILNTPTSTQESLEATSPDTKEQEGHPKSVESSPQRAPCAERVNVQKLVLLSSIPQAPTVAAAQASPSTPAAASPSTPAAASPATPQQVLKESLEKDDPGYTVKVIYTRMPTSPQTNMFEAKWVRMANNPKAGCKEQVLGVGRGPSKAAAAQEGALRALTDVFPEKMTEHGFQQPPPRA